MFRVWNSQLIRFAGYDDGLGDPASKELTGVAMAMGWEISSARH